MFVERAICEIPTDSPVHSLEWSPVLSSEFSVINHDGEVQKAFMYIC